MAEPTAAEDVADEKTAFAPVRVNVYLFLATFVAVFLAGALYRQGFEGAPFESSAELWRAVIEARAQRRMTPRAQRRFAALEKELQESYALSGD